MQCSSLVTTHFSVAAFDLPLTSRPFSPVVGGYSMILMTMKNNKIVLTSRDT